MEIRGFGYSIVPWEQANSDLPLISLCDTIIEGHLNTKQRRTLESIFVTPNRSDIAWRDIESLLNAEGAEIAEGSGSRIRVVLNGVRAVFHRPHPQQETKKRVVGSVRRFLEEAGVVP